MTKYMKESGVLFGIYLMLVPCAAICSALFSLNLAPLLNVVYTKNIHDFLRYALLECILAILDLVTHYFHKVCREKLRTYYVAGVKRDIFNALLSKNITDFNSNSVGQYISIINRDVDKMNRCHFDSICGIYRVTICFIINLILVVYINPAIAILNISISLFSVFIPRMFERSMIEKQEKASQNSETYYSVLKDYLHGFSTIKLFNIQDIIKRKMESSNQDLEKANFSSTVTNYTSSWISMCCSQFSFVLTIVLGIWFALKGWMTIGSVISLSQLIGGITVPFEELPEHISNYKSIKGIQEKINSIMKTGEESIDQSKTLDVVKENFEVENLSYSYNESGAAIQNVSFELKEHGKYILVGTSGSGKSTIAKLLMRFYEADAGTVKFGGRLLSEYSEKQFYRTATYLEQDIFLFDDTLLNNITLYQTYSEEEVARVLRLSGLEEVVNQLPNGIETVIKGNGYNFSGGEKQRIGIARALILGAKFLICDEVTASLDPVLAASVENTIMNLPDTGVLYITHKWSKKLFEKSDGIFVLKDGEIIESGCFDELMERKEYFYSYYYTR